MPSHPDLATRLAAAQGTLASVGQPHVLHFYPQLTDAERSHLLDQIDSVDWPEVARLIETHVKHKPHIDLPSDVKPAPCYPHEPADATTKEKFKQAWAEGERLVRAGKVAAFTVAGGQGSRLGWDAPKGTFPATPIRGFPLFGVFAEYLIKSAEKWGHAVPWYIMTSPANDADTRRFFADKKYFDLDPANVSFFPQAMMPAIDSHSHLVLLESKSSLALSPNGHGGSLKALYTSGAIADMRRRGIEQISYTQVDNPLVRMVDPLFIGLHALDHCQMSSKMIPKTGPLERVGNFALVNGKMTVIEYSDLPETLAKETLPDGSLKFRAGSIAIHVLRVDFVESLNVGWAPPTSSPPPAPTVGGAHPTPPKPETRNPGSFALPYHRAEKKVPHLDLPTGQSITPTKPNAIKLETFVFDALPFCERSIVYETDRADEFAPIKNADSKPGEPPAVDSPQSSKDMQIARAAKWLELTGVKVPRRPDGAAAATIEITQRTAIYPRDLADANLPNSIEPGAQSLI